MLNMASKEKLSSVKSKNGLIYVFLVAYLTNFILVRKGNDN